jgi:hypothetical protein
MDKSVSIAPVDRKTYRKIAQENWGLTDEQMAGMHVHHRVPRSEGGTNDASNLYVCSPSFHMYVWHTRMEFIMFATEAGRKSAKAKHAKKNENGKSKEAVRLGKISAKLSHQEKDAQGRSKRAVKMAESTHSKRDENGKSLVAIKAGHAAHREKNEEGKSKMAVESGYKTLAKNVGIFGRSQQQHSEDSKKAAEKLHSKKDEKGRSVVAMKTLTQVWESTVDGFRSTPGAVALHNKARGWDPNARIRIK